MIHCPSCGNNTLANPGTGSHSKQVNSGLNFPEGNAISAMSFSNIMAVQCTHCKSVYVHVSKGVEFLLNPA